MVHFYMKSSLFLSFIFLLVFNMVAQKKLAILGSSTSACTGPSTIDSCYVTRVQKHYQAIGTQLSITNLAVGGASVYRGMPSSYSPPPERSNETPDQFHNITAALATNPDVILVNYPSNGYDVFSVSEVLFCLRTIRQAANDAGKPCYITTPQPRSSPFSFTTNETRRKMIEIRDGVLNEFGSYAINFWDGIANPADGSAYPEYSAGDGVHFNNAGHAALAQRVIQKNIFDPPSAAGGRGLKYRYYEGDWNALPDFNALSPVKTGSTLNVDMSSRNVSDYYGFVWEGYINIATAGNYTFETLSDDGSKLYFNSFYSAGAQALVNNDGLHGTRSVTGNVYVSAPGLYPIAITFFEKGYGESMQVFWSGPGFGRQPVPNSAFSSNPEAEASGLQFRYYEGDWNALPDFNALAPVKTGYSSNVDMRARNVSDHYGFVWEGYITIAAAGMYTFETISDDGSKLYFNSFYSAGAQALVNNDGLHGERSVSASVYIPAPGLYPVAITFFEKGFGEAMQVLWSGPGFGRQFVPNSAFSSNQAAQAGGFKYRYYEGNWDALPDFNALAPAKTGSSPNIDMSARNVSDHYGFVWEGYINIANAGNYTFETVSDDGSKLYFNSFYSAGAQALVNNDGLHPLQSRSGTVYVPSAGRYPVAITFFEKNGGENMQVYWSGPGFSRQPVPNSVVTSIVVMEDHELTSSLPLNLKKEYADLTVSKVTEKGAELFFNAYPNPFKESFNVEFKSSTGRYANIEVYDLSGKILHHAYFGKLSGGYHNIKVNLANKQALIPGTYFAVLKLNGIPVQVFTLLKVKN